MQQTTLNKARRHLRNSDPVMAELIRLHNPRFVTAKRSNHYHTIVRTIINQQLSVKAGQTIVKRLLDKQGGRVFKAEKLNRLRETSFRRCGLSKSKTRYVRTITRAILDKEFSFRALEQQDDQTIIDTLTAYPGIGPWSAEIILIASFGRWDVFPIGDLVLRRAMQHYYALAQEADETDYRAIAEPWRPYRTIASRYLWAAVN